MSRGGIEQYRSWAGLAGHSGNTAELENRYFAAKAQNEMLKREREARLLQGDVRPQVAGAMAKESSANDRRESKDIMVEESKTDSGMDEMLPFQELKSAEEEMKQGDMSASKVSKPTPTDILSAAQEKRQNGELIPPARDNNSRNDRKRTNSNKMNEDRLLNPSIRWKLGELSREVKQSVEKNHEALSHATVSGAELQIKELERVRRRLQMQKDKELMRAQIEKTMHQSHNNNNNNNSSSADSDLHLNLDETDEVFESKLPMWRHRLLGNNRPKPENVLRGKNLFRAIAMSCVGIIIRPIRLVRQHKLQGRERERADLNRTVRLYVDSCCNWMGRVVQAAFISIEEDKSLNFDFRHSHLTKWGQFSEDVLLKRLVQLKVRLKAVVNSLAESEMPPPHILDFLGTLTDDDNYFPPSYIWPSELKALEFNDLEGTRNMLPPLEEDVDNSNGSSVDWRNEGFYLFQEKFGKLEEYRELRLAYQNVAESAVFNASRVKLLIKNFLLARILVGHVCLSPWNYGACPLPAKHISQIVLNCRVMASVLFDLIRPTLAASPYPRLLRKQGFQFKKNIRRSTVRIQAGDVESGMVETANTSNAMQTLESWCTSTSDWIVWKLRVNYVSLSDWASQSETLIDKTSDIENKLLGAREPYLQQIDFLELLLDSSSFEFDGDVIEEWLEELSGKLDNWCDSIVVAVLKRRDKSCTVVSNAPESVSVVANETGTTAKNSGLDASATLIQSGVTNVVKSSTKQTPAREGTPAPLAATEIPAPAPPLTAAVSRTESARNREGTSFGFDYYNSRIQALAEDEESETAGQLRPGQAVNDGTSIDLEPSRVRLSRMESRNLSRQRLRTAEGQARASSQRSQLRTSSKAAGNPSVQSSMDATVSNSRKPTPFFSVV